MPMRYVKDFFRSMLGDGENLDHYEPTPISEPGSGANFNRFSDMLPYTAWIDEHRLFVLEGEEPESVAGLGFVLEMIPQTGASQEMADLMTTIFTYLPTGASVQWILAGTPLVDDFLDAYVSCRLNPSDFDPDSEVGERVALYREMAVRRAQHFARGTISPLVPNTPYLLRRFRLLMAVTIPATTYDNSDLNHDVVTLRETCCTTLQTYYQFSHEWEPEDLINWCNVMLNPQETILKRNAQHLNYDDGRLLKQQMVAPDTVIRISDSGIRFGLPQHNNEIIARCMSVRSYPKACTLHAMGNAIGDAMQNALGYTSPFVLGISIISQDFEKTRAVTQMKAARATQKADSPMARFMPELSDLKHDWDVAQKAFDEGKGTVKMLHQLVLYAKPQDMPRAEQAAQAVWRALQFELVTDTFMQIQGFLGMLPMFWTTTFQEDVRKAQRLTTKTVTNAVNMAPLLAEWRGTGCPVMALWGRRGQAIGVDLFSNTAGNYNGCVVGTSGSGKSVFLNDLSLSYLSVGGRVWIIDIGRSYEKLCSLVGGQYIEFTSDSGICLNPFSFVEDIDEDMDMILPMFGQMISPNEPLDDYRRRQLIIHLQSVWYEFGSDATVDHLAHSLVNNCEKGGPNPRGADEEYAAMVRDMTYEQKQAICDPRIRDMGVQLHPFTSDGHYGKYFSGPANIDFTTDFIVLELEELASKPDLQSVVLFLLMYKITQEMYLTRERPKVCIIDEAWSLLNAGGGGAEFIESGYRRARKYNGSFCTATQAVTDYYNSLAATAALNNADWMFLLRQKPESVLALEKSDKLVLDDYMKNMLLSVKTSAGAYAEVFVHAGQMGSGVGRLLLDPFTLLLVSSKPEDYNAITAYREQGYSIADAIDAVLRDRNASASHGRRAA